VSEDLTCTESARDDDNERHQWHRRRRGCGRGGTRPQLVVEDGFHSPETDAAIAKVVRHNGEVIVVRNGDITDLGRVALLLRY